MKANGPSDPEEFGQLKQRITELENRISRLEEAASYGDRGFIIKSRHQADQPDDQGKV